MADNAQRLQEISANIEKMYQALRRAAANISGLLSLGRATCDEIKAYNLWALATYETQRGMLATLRANGERGVPELPTAPTLFTWRGVAGAEAWRVDCSGEAKSLAGAMTRALKGPDKATQFLSTNEIQIVTQDQAAYDPTAAPSFKALVQAQQANQAGLGAVGIVIAIAGIALAVSVAIAAIMHYLEVNEVQEAQTKQTALQAEAFATYTQARLQCLSTCTGKGGSVDDCVDQCNKLIAKPNIRLPGDDGAWGTLQWIGFTVVAGLGAVAAYKLYQRKQAGKPLFELPDFDDSTEPA